MKKNKVAEGLEQDSRPGTTSMRTFERDLEGVKHTLSQEWWLPRRGAKQLLRPPHTLRVRALQEGIWRVPETPGKLQSPKQRNLESCKIVVPKVACPRTSGSAASFPF